MARKPRIEFPGAFYHVIARGNNRQKVFVDDEDYRFFLGRLKFYKNRFGFILYTYALMPNHIHLLIETGDVPLSRIMQALQFTYTQKFNRKHKKVGHLFQGRYKAILCQKENYLLELIRYISLNPVRAGLVKNPIAWRWGSFYEVIRSKGEHIVSFDEALGLFGKQIESAARVLQKHVNSGLSEGHNEAYYKLKDQRVLGENDFAQEIIKMADAQSRDFEYRNLNIEDVVKMVAGQTDIKQEMIRSIGRDRVGAKARGMVTYICRSMCGKNTKEVCKYFGRSEPVLSKSFKKIEVEVADQRSDTSKVIRKITSDIKKKYPPCLVREIK